VNDVVDGAALEVELLRERTRQLQTALTSRVAVDTAVGVLLERHALERQDAFELLRRAARHHRRSIHDLAHEVTKSRTDTPEIAAVLALVRR
jgi:AmiR/NasT family two-component response regulator